MKVYILILFDDEGESVDKVFASYSAMSTFVKEELGENYNGIIDFDGKEYYFSYKGKPKNGLYRKCEVHELIGVLQPKDYINCS